MTNELLRLAVLMISFIASYWALLSVDFERFIKKGRTTQAQILCVLLSMGLSYLIYNFIMALQLFI